MALELHQQARSYFLKVVVEELQGSFHFQVGQEAEEYRHWMVEEERIFQLLVLVLATQQLKQL